MATMEVVLNIFYNFSPRILFFSTPRRIINEGSTEIYTMPGIVLGIPK